MPQTPNAEPPTTEAAQLSTIDRIKYGAQLAVVAAQVSPANEAARYALLGSTLLATGDTAAAAAVYGGSTLAIEGAAAVATSSLLDSPKAQNVTDRLGNKLNEFNVPKEGISNKALKAGVAVYGGSAITSAIKKIENPDMDKAELRDYGLKVSMGLAVLCTAEGALIAEGVSHPSPETIGGAALALGALAVGYKMVKRKLATRQQKGTN